ncbi:MAG TPA: PAS domain S-box protein [Phycisphaerae bacterium]|nr:PAS domain S-box protein [Phycisphaerae bacterium]
MYSGWFLPAGLIGDDPDERRRAHVLMWFWAATVIWSPIYTTIYYLLDCAPAAHVIMLWTVFAFAVPIVLRHSGSIRMAGNAFVFVLASLLVVLIGLTGGHHSFVRPWLVLVPALAVTLSGLRSTVIWTTIVLGYVITLSVLAVARHEEHVVFHPHHLHTLELLSSCTLIILICILALTYERFQRRMLEQATERTSALHRALARNETINRELQHMNEALNAQIAERRHAEQALRDSEYLLSNIISNIPHFVFWKDLESKYLGCNRHFATIAGFDDPGQIRGLTDFQLAWTRAEAEWYRACDRRVMDSGEPLIDIEESQRRADGSDTVLMTSKVPLRNAAGQVFGVLGIFADITARKELEERLLLQSTALAAAANAVLIADITGRICWVNPAFTALTGYSYDEAVGGLANILKSGVQDAAFYRRMWATISAGRVWQGELRNRRKDGTLYDEAMTITPVRGEGDRITHYIAIKQDVAERRRGERLAQERDELRATVKAHEQFLGVVGHELRTPLAGLMIIAEFLLREDTRNTAEFDTFLHSIHEEIVRMSGVVNDLIEVARLNSGIAKFQWGQVDVRHACTDAVSSIRPLVDGQHVRLEVSVEPPDLTMRGDESAIRRLVLNLLSNAQKNTRQGTIRVTASAAACAGQPWVEIAISDTGAGMTAETAARLGEAFALNAGIVGDTNVAGSGLGLAICRGIVSAHGGSLAVMSGLGRGTTCTVRLRADLERPCATDALVEIHAEVEK